jgi:DNA-binding IclR family transcriptional regulator
MERAEISLHQLRVFQYVAHASGWVTSAEIARGAPVAPRTARAHAHHLVSLGIFDQAEVFPAHRYRLSPQAEKRNKGYLLRLQQATEVFGQSV